MKYLPIKNNSIAVALLLINTFAIIVYALHDDMMRLAPEPLANSQTFQTKFDIELVIVGALVLLTCALLKNFRTPAIQTINIRFPFMLHLALLTLELAYTIHMARTGIALEMREALYDGTQQIPKVARVSSLLLYMTTMLLFLRIALQANDSFTQITPKYYLIIAFTFLVFIFKGFAVGSRGSAINIIVFALAGWTYARPLRPSMLFKNFPQYIFGGAIALAILIPLTFVRTGTSRFDAIWDTLFIRFSTNIGVSIKFLSNDLLYRLASGGEYFSEWTLARSEFLYLDFDFIINLLPTVKSFVSYLSILNPEDQVGSIYFNMYDQLPYNSFHFTLPLIASQLLGVMLFIGFLFLFVRISRLSIAINFFSYCYLFYCALLSFTSFSFFEVPFILIPILAMLFVRCIKIRLLR